MSVSISNDSKTFMEVKENRDAPGSSFIDSGLATPVLFIESTLALQELSKLTCL